MTDSAMDADPDAQRWITPRFSGRLQDQTIVMILFKPSPAYDIAVSRMLAVWAERGLAPSVLLVLVHNDLQRANLAAQHAQKIRAALIVGVGSDSAAFLHDHYRNGTVPLLSVCAKDPVLMKQVSAYQTGGGASMAYTSLNAPVDVQLDHLQRVRPDLRDLAILVDRRNSSAWQTQTLPLEAAARQAGIRVMKVVVDSGSPIEPQLQEALSSALDRMRADDPNGGGSLIWVTGSSALFGHLRLINRLAGTVPVASAVPDLVLPGMDSADLSIGVGFEENAYLAALYAQRILERRVRPGDLPVGVVSPPEIAIHFGKTRQSGLRIPFAFFEKAATVYDPQGARVRWRGIRVDPSATGDS